MKKLFMLIPLVSMLLVGCDRNEYNTEGNRNKIEPNFEVICRHVDNFDVSYLRDIDTDMIYVLFGNTDFNSGLSVYYNKKGEPMKYQEFKTVHIEKYHH